MLRNTKFAITISELLREKYPDSVIVKGFVYEAAITLFRSSYLLTLEYDVFAILH